jgi:energy-coupling factor transporter transmembrane protein EcfT
MGMVFIGILLLMTAFLILIIGLVTKKRDIKKLGLVFLTLPLVFAIILILFYGVAVPWSNQKMMEKYSDQYLLESASEKVILTLKNDGTYNFNTGSELALSSKGTWKTGGIDGLFEIIEDDGTHHWMQHGTRSNAKKVVILRYGNKEFSFVEE